MAEPEYQRPAQQSRRKRAGTCSCPAKEGRAVRKFISTQDLNDQAAVLTEPFDNSVAHAICSLCRFCQHSTPLIARWPGMGGVLSPSNAQRQYEEVECTLRVLLFPIVPVQQTCRGTVVVRSMLSVESLGRKQRRLLIQVKGSWPASLALCRTQRR